MKPLLAVILSKTLVGLLALMLSKLSLADSGVYYFSFPTLSQAALERTRAHQWARLGTAWFQEGVPLPAYSISIQNPVSDGLIQQLIPCQAQSLQTQPCRFNFKLRPAQAKQLAALNIGGMGWFLVPRNWKTIEADMGANGSKRLLMLSPDGQEYLSFADTSACEGCALQSASLLFPEARQQAQKNEFSYYSRSNVALKKVTLNRQTVLFSYQLPQHYRSDGVARFTGMPAEVVNFNQLIVSLKPENKPLAQAMLNFYLFTH